MIFSSSSFACAFLSLASASSTSSWRLILSHSTATGSSDSSIRYVVPNDLSVILDHAPIERIFCNGAASLNCYRRYIEPQLRRPAVSLPSTSPANAAWSLPRLIEAWRAIL